MKAFSLVTVAFGIALVGTSCTSQRNLAQFGDFTLSAFGNSDAEASAASEAPPSQQLSTPAAPSSPDAPAPVISDADPVVAMARAEAAGDTVSGAPAPTLISTQSSPSTPLPTATQPTYASVPTTTSTFEYAEDIGRSIPNKFVVKTTAYTHTEADHIEYGTKTALGDQLKFGMLRSAAADWSRYPVGTRFKIKGLPYEYVVDDYGSALVGTDTIDLYKPNSLHMDEWGARNVGIEVLEWGSFEESKRILESRKHKPSADHVRRMLRNIEEKIDRIPQELRDGFRA